MSPRLIHHPAAGPSTGRPFLFVHGALHGAWCWRDNFLPWFAERGRDAWAVELRGHGESVDHRVLLRSRLRDFVDDVAAAVAEIGAPAPVLVGHSMGGMLVQKYLERRMAPAAVLFGSAPPSGVLRPTLRGVVRHLPAAARGVATRHLGRLVGTPRLARDLLFCDDTPQEVVDAACRRLGDESPLAFLDMTVLDLPDPRRVFTPVTVVGARDDGLLSRREVEATAAAYHTRPVFVPGGHDLMLDVGWQEAAELVLGVAAEGVTR